MLAFGIILLTTGVLLMTVSVLLCCGFISLLHEYHRNNVKEEDRKRFGLSIGMSLMIGALGLVATGTISIVTLNESLIISLIIIFTVLLIISTVLSLIFVKKYNKKILG